MLIINPEKTSPFLFNMMGVFWLANGLLLVRHAHPFFAQQQNKLMGKRYSILLGLVGFLAGLLVMSKVIILRFVPEDLVIVVLGSVILLNGVLHLIGEAQVEGAVRNRRSVGQIVQAIFEIFLGALLVISPLEQNPLVYWIATLWAPVGGIFKL